MGSESSDEVTFWINVSTRATVHLPAPPPPPHPTLALACYWLTFVGLGEE